MPVTTALAALLWVAAPAWIDAAPTDEAGAREDESPDTMLLSGHTTPGLLDVSQLTLRLRSNGMFGARMPYESEASLEVEGEVAHPFSGKVADVVLGVAVFPAKDEAFVWRRLTQPPLQLMPDELDAELPKPMATWSSGPPIAEEVLPNERRDFEASAELGEITIDPFSTPRVLVNVETYTLVDPAPGDVIQILKHGGTADLAALASWASGVEASGASPFGEGSKHRIMTEARAVLQAMRAPPSLGDYQRLGAFSAVVRAFATREDTEPLLALQRMLKILQTSAYLSFDAARSEETALDLAVHGLRTSPSHTHIASSVISSLQVLKRIALDRVLRHAFDPHDFREAPATMQVSDYQEQAMQLLAPLVPNEVGPMLRAAGGNAEVERGILRFYVDAQHAPVTEPLVDWLLQHPEDVSTLGVLAATTLHETMLPVVLRIYTDPEDPADRKAMRELLMRMPEVCAPRLVESLRTLGLEVPSDLDATTAAGRLALFDLFEKHEQRFLRSRAKALVAEMLDPDDRVSAMRAAVRSLARLAQLAPDLVHEHAPALIETLGEAALYFGEDNPVERLRALGHLETVPWGDFTAKARKTQVLTEAELEVRQDEVWEALERLLEFDPELADPDIRMAFRELARSIFERELAASHLVEATKILETMREKFPDDIDIEAWEHRLLWARYKPAFLLGGAFALTIVTSLSWLLAQLVRKVISLFARRRGDAARMDRRRKDAEANVADAASFAHDVNTTGDGTQAPPVEAPASPSMTAPGGTIVAPMDAAPPSLPNPRHTLGFEEVDASLGGVLDDADPLESVGSWLDDDEDDDSRA